jgi:hypothetical protein
VKVGNLAPADVDHVEAFVLVGCAALRASMTKPFDAHEDVPRWTRDDHAPNLKAQLGIQAEQAFKPSPHGSAAVALAAKRRFAGEDVVDVNCHPIEGLLIVSAAESAEGRDDAAPYERVLHEGWKVACCAPGGFEPV